MNCNICGREFWLGTDGLKYEIDNHTVPHVCVLTQEQKAKEWEERKKNDSNNNEKNNLYQEMHDENIEVYKGLTAAINNLAAAIREKK